MNVALIPARGGSKRIPRKNIRPFAGRPMIEWSISAALAAGTFDHVLVSTDDEEIAGVAARAGAAIPFRRPAALSNDYATTAEVVEHALGWMDAEGWRVDAVCCIYATAPFVTAADLARAGDVLREDVDYVFAAGRYSYPVHRSLMKRTDGGVHMLFPEHSRTRSQDLPEIYHDAGQFYWGHSEAWREQRPIFGERSRFVELSPWRVQDIDTPEDWMMAEHLFEIVRRTLDGR